MQKALKLSDTFARACLLSCDPYLLHEHKDGFQDAKLRMAAHLRSVTTPSCDSTSHVDSVSLSSGWLHHINSAKTVFTGMFMRTASVSDVPIVTPLLACMNVTGTCAEQDHSTNITVCGGGTAAAVRAPGAAVQASH